MDWVQEYQLFLFDFDGLLVDTEPLHCASYLEMSRRRGCPLNWDLERFCMEAHGKSMGFFDGLEREYPDVFKSGPSKEELYAEKKRIYIEMLQSNRLELMEGALPLLTALEERGIKTAVVTNSPRDQIEIIKRVLPDLQKIPVWITREDYTEAKPSPEGYQKAIQMLAKPGDRIIGFEDTLKGLKALLAAGVEAVLVCSADGERDKEALKLGARHCDKLSVLSTALR